MECPHEIERLNIRIKDLQIEIVELKRIIAELRAAPKGTEVKIVEKIVYKEKQESDIERSYREEEEEEEEFQVVEVIKQSETTAVIENRQESSGTVINFNRQP